jgi:DNA polymerase-3 subunit epsilon
LELLCKALRKDTDLLELNTFLKRGKGDAFLPMHLNKESYFKLPEKPGVYYFRNSTGKIIYVGKAKNLKKRVRQHFSGKLKSAQKQAFIRDIVEIDFLETGTELIAALKEDREIKHLWPKYNRAQKNPKRKFGVFHYSDREGKSRLAVQNMTASMTPIRSFSSTFKARQWLYDFGEEYKIPNHRLGLPASEEDKKEKNSKTINKKIDKALAKVNSLKESFLIKGAGRGAGEKSVILVKDNEYAGFGYVSDFEELKDVGQVESAIEYAPHSDFSISLIEIFVEKGSAGEVIPLEKLE